MRRLLISALMLMTAQPAYAGDASDFMLVNGTSVALADLSISRAGSGEWKPLGPAPSAGARAPVTFKDQECAFDIRATVAGSGPVTWAGVSLCGAKSVTLNRDGSAGAWVDYDQ